MNRAAVKRYMRELISQGECVEFGEVNTTLLGEAACHHFDAYEDDDGTIPEEFWDWAFEVSEERTP